MLKEQFNIQELLNYLQNNQKYKQTLKNAVISFCAQTSNSRFQAEKGNSGQAIQQHNYINKTENNSSNNANEEESLADAKIKDKLLSKISNEEQKFDVSYYNSKIEELAMATSETISSLIAQRNSQSLLILRDQGTLILQKASSVMDKLQQKFEEFKQEITNQIDKIGILNQKGGKRDSQEHNPIEKPKSTQAKKNGQQLRKNILQLSNAKEKQQTQKQNEEAIKDNYQEQKNEKSNSQEAIQLNSRLDLFEKSNNESLQKLQGKIAKDLQNQFEGLGTKMKDLKTYFDQRLQSSLAGIWNVIADLETKILAK